MRTLLLIPILFISLTTSAGQVSTLERAFITLDSIVDNYDVIRDEHIKEIEQEKTRLSDRAITGYLDIARRYIGINMDSAFHYASICYEKSLVADSTALAYKAQIARAGILSTTHKYIDAEDIFKSIDLNDLDDSTRVLYYTTIGDLYLDYLLLTSGNDSRYKYTEQSIAALSSVEQLSPDGSPSRRLARAQIDYLTGNYTIAVGELIDLLDCFKDNETTYSRIANMIALYYKSNPAKREEYIYYLSIAATYELSGMTTRPIGLSKLANEAFNDGYIEKAAKYIKITQRVIKYADSFLFGNELLNISTQINAEIEAQYRRYNTITTVCICILASIVIILIIILIVKQHRTKEHLEDNKLLNDSVATRELYINQLLNICSSMVEGMEDFSRMAGRKLKAGQAMDLYDMIESGKLLQEQLERFFVVFDAAILRIFPNFQAELNNLLQPDKQIVSPGLDKLTPEQRIVAFMRLGVMESHRIAKFLGLSLNTVYTYRNRTKSRAIDREKFENDIRNICKNAYS
ncbi:MAG: DUF6377 domain-containing protein [Muribaculaceae bacterium]